MVTCPKCGRSIAGNPRACGYCGASLVSNYFSQSAPALPRSMTDAPHLGAGAVASLVLGIFGAVSLLCALAFWLSPLFSAAASPPETTALWWAMTLVMTLFPVVYLTGLLIQHGQRVSLLFDCAWLFLAACGLSLTAQAFIDRGVSSFGGVTAIPYLLAVGCALVLVATTTAVITYQA